MCSQLSCLVKINTPYSIVFYDNVARQIFGYNLNNFILWYLFNLKAKKNYEAPNKVVSTNMKMEKGSIWVKWPLDEVFKKNGRS